MKKKLTILISSAIALSAAMPEYYYEIKNKKEQKLEFFKIITPLVQQENKNILRERNSIKAIFSTLEANDNNLSSLSKEMLVDFISLPKKYKIKDMYDKKSLLTRIDTIPVSLALAQAATESGWGKSRFIKIANNIFGHWTYSKTGILPKKREKGKTHRIRVFKTLQDSVKAYMFNLNKNRAYIPFRAKRLEFLNAGKTFLGKDAAEKMDKYSAIGQKYVKLLKTIIKGNKLEDYSLKVFDNNVSHETLDKNITK